MALTKGTGYPRASGWVGPDEPEGDKATNWIPTLPGRAWFPHFRLYSPTQAFPDHSWVLPDIEKAG